jgi:coenzyme PQQ synthesis protein D (PqqD)
LTFRRPKRNCLNYQRGSLLSIGFGTIVVVAGISHAKDGTLRGIPQCFPEPFGSEVRPMHKVSDSIRSTHGQDGAIVLDIRQGQIFNLNLVGSRILELLECGSTEEQITDAIRREFSADIETVRKDVADFLEELKANKLVDAAPANGSL